MIEVRSFRRVFDLERRIYRVDRVRLNPGGVPVRGVVYLLATLAATLAASRLPLAGLAIARLPWLLGYVALPGITAALLTVIRIDGRPFHLAARALLRCWAGRGQLRGLGPPRRRSSGIRDGRWAPGPILMLPDGGDGGHRLRYTGPGAVRIAIAHERTSGRPLLVKLRLRPHVVVRLAAGAHWPPSGAVILMGKGVRASVR